jgi:hypothetical protein
MSRPISIKNVETGEITDFASVADCAAYFNLSLNAVRNRIDSNTNDNSVRKAFRGKFTIKDTGKSPWPVERAWDYKAFIDGRLARNPNLLREWFLQNDPQYKALVQS